VSFKYSSIQSVSDHERVENECVLNLQRLSRNATHPVESLLWVRRCAIVLYFDCRLAQLTTDTIRRVESICRSQNRCNRDNSQFAGDSNKPLFRRSRVCCRTAEEGTGKCAELTALWLRIPAHATSWPVGNGNVGVAQQVDSDLQWSR